MEMKELALPGLIRITPTIFTDDRGFFLETFNKDRYEPLGVEFVQDNMSKSKKNSLRGMHFQTEPGQAKLVSVIQGEILDVVVDMRLSSPTFKQWLGVTLDSKLREQLFIPVGFAHGFCVLSEEALVQYKVSALYNAETERGFAYNDPTISIEWPVAKPLLSQRDIDAPPFSEALCTHSY